MANTFLRNFLFDIYCYTFFNSFLVLSPIYTIFMQKNGVSDIQISFLLIIWVIGVLITQIPITRIISRFGARFTMIFGQILLIIGYSLWAVFPTFTFFAIGMFLSGVQSAIYNVVPESLIYNTVSGHGEKQKYTKILGQRRNFSLAGSGLATFGSLLYIYGYNFLTIISIISLIFSIFFVSRIKTTTNSTIGVDFSFKELPKITKILHKNKTFLIFLLLNVLVINFTFLNDFLPVIGTQISISDKYIGFLLLFLLLCQMVGHWLAQFCSNMKNIFLFFWIMIGGVLFLLFGRFYSITGIIFLGLAYTLFGVIKIILYSRMQHSLSTNNRLIGLSFYNLFNQFFYGITCLILGFGANIGSWRYGILCLGICLIFVGILPVIFYHSRKQ